MGLIVDKVALHRAIDESCKTINAQNQQLCQISSACDSLNGENLLTGQAWQAAKQQADALSRQINDALAYNQAVLDDHRTLATLLDQYIDDDFIAEDAVTQALGCLRRVDQAIEAVRDLLPPVTSNLVGPAINDLLEQDRRTGQWLQDKIDRLRQFDQATSALYGGDKENTEAGDIKVGNTGDEDDDAMKGKGSMEPPPTGLLNDSEHGGDPLQPGELAQDQISDCWLISTLDALIDAGYDLKGNIREGSTKDGHPCYFVTIYDHGKPVEVEVDEIYTHGVHGNWIDPQGVIHKGACIASLYEAAIRKYFGKGSLSGGDPSNAWQMITGQYPLRSDGDPVGEAQASNGSIDGTISVATTPVFYWHSPWDGHYSKDGFRLFTVKDGPMPGDASREDYIIPDHAYEVVEVQGDMICLRNPWGHNLKPNPDKTDKDYPYIEDDSDFWISKDDFDKLFNSDMRPDNGM